jgi:hypothetical protein
MTTSKTIAALLGPTLIATAVSLLANLDILQTLIEGLSQSPALIMIAGYAAFVPGLAIVYFHNRWTNGWPVLVTVMGWLSLVVGLLRMVFPTQLAAMATKNCSGRRGRLSCLRGRIPADRRVSLVQGFWSRVTRRRGYRSVASKTSASVAKLHFFTLVIVHEGRGWKLVCILPNAATLMFRRINDRSPLHNFAFAIGAIRPPSQHGERVRCVARRARG